MTTTAPAIEPGVHQLTDDEYFGPALAHLLSSTGARTLLKPGGPARFKHQLDTGTVEVKREFDLGHAVHTLVLGSGPMPVQVVGSGKDPNAWNTDKTRAEVAQRRADGDVPLRPADFVAAKDMTLTVVRHPIAKKLLANGQPERTLIWQDPATGVMCRAKADWLRTDGIVDLKTTVDASEDALSKAAHNYGYAIQAAFYMRGFFGARRGLTTTATPFFVHIAVEKEPPYLVHVNQLTARAIAWGDRQVSAALEIYRDCRESGVWPGYPEDEITDIDLPAWVREDF